MPSRVGFALFILSACAVAHESLEVEASGVLNKRLVRREKKDVSTFYIGPDGFPDSEDAVRSVATDSDTNIEQHVVEVQGGTLGDLEGRRVSEQIGNSDLEKNAALKLDEVTSSPADESHMDEQLSGLAVPKQATGEVSMKHPLDSPALPSTYLDANKDEQEPLPVPVANAASQAPASSVVPPAQTDATPPLESTVPGVTASPLPVVVDHAPVVGQPRDAVPGPAVVPVVVGPPAPSELPVSVVPQQADVPQNVPAAPGAAATEGPTLSPVNVVPQQAALPTNETVTPAVSPTVETHIEENTNSSVSDGNLTQAPHKSFRSVWVPIALGGVITMFGLAIVYLAIWTGKKPASGLASRASGYSQQRRLRDTLRATPPEGGPTAQAGEGASGYAQQRRVRDQVSVRSASESVEVDNQETLPPPEESDQASGRTNSHGGSRYGAQRSARTSQNKPGSARAPLNQPEEQQEEHTW